MIALQSAALVILKLINNVIMNEDTFVIIVFVAADFINTLVITRSHYRRFLAVSCKIILITLMVKVTLSKTTS